MGGSFLGILLVPSCLIAAVVPIRRTMAFVVAPPTTTTTALLLRTARHHHPVHHRPPRTATTTTSLSMFVPFGNTPSQNRKSQYSEESFFPQAFAMEQQAEEVEHAAPGDYEQAFPLYHDALACFNMALKYETAGVYQKDLDRIRTCQQRAAQLAEHVRNMLQRNELDDEVAATLPNELERFTRVSEEIAENISRAVIKPEPVEEEPPPPEHQGETWSPPPPSRHQQQQHQTGRSSDASSYEVPFGGVSSYEVPFRSSSSYEVPFGSSAGNTGFDSRGTAATRERWRPSPPAEDDVSARYSSSSGAVAESDAFAQRIVSPAPMRRRPTTASDERHGRTTDGEAAPSSYPDEVWSSPPPYSNDTRSSAFSGPSFLEGPPGQEERRPFTYEGTSDVTDYDRGREDALYHNNESFFSPATRDYYAGPPPPPEEVWTRRTESFDDEMWQEEEVNIESPPPQFNWAFTENEEWREEEEEEEEEDENVVSPESSSSEPVKSINETAATGSSSASPSPAILPTTSSSDRATSATEAPPTTPEPPAPSKHPSPSSGSSPPSSQTTVPIPGSSPSSLSSGINQKEKKPSSFMYRGPSSSSAKTAFGSYLDNISGGAMASMDAIIESKSTESASPATQVAGTGPPPPQQQRTGSTSGSFLDSLGSGASVESKPSNSAYRGPSRSSAATGLGSYLENISGAKPWEKGPDSVELRRAIVVQQERSSEPPLPLPTSAESTAPLATPVDESRPPQTGSISGSSFLDSLRSAASAESRPSSYMLKGASDSSAISGLGSHLDKQPIDTTSEKGHDASFPGPSFGKEATQENAQMIESLQSKLDASEEERRKLESRMSELEAGLRAARVELEKSTASSSSNEEFQKHFDEKISALSKQHSETLERVKADHQAALNRLHEEYSVDTTSKLEKQYAELTSLVESQKARFDEERAHFRESEEAMRKQAQLIQSLQEKLNFSEDKIRKAESKMSRSEANRQAAPSKLENSSVSAIEELQKQFDEKLSALRKEHSETLERVVADHQAALNGLREENEALKSKLEIEASAQKEQRSQLESVKKQMDNTVENSSVTVASLLAQQQELEKEKSEFAARVTELEDELQSKSNTLEEWTEKLRALTETLNALSEERKEQGELKDTAKLSTQHEARNGTEQIGLFPSKTNGTFLKLWKRLQKDRDELAP